MRYPNYKNITHTVRIKQHHKAQRIETRLQAATLAVVILTFLMMGA